MPSSKKKQNKIAAFGSISKRVPIASIAACAENSGGNITLLLKSGSKVVMDFDIPYLSNLAMEELDKFFDLTLPEAIACNVCVRKDKVDPDEADKAGWDKYCDHCYDDRERFQGPNGENMDGEILDEKE